MFDLRHVLILEREVQKLVCVYPSLEERVCFQITGFNVPEYCFDNYKQFSKSCTYVSKKRTSRLLMDFPT